MVTAPASDASTLKLQPHSLDFSPSSPPHTFPKWIKPTQEGLNPPAPRLRRPTAAAAIPGVPGPWGRILMERHKRSGKPGSPFPLKHPWNSVFPLGKRLSGGSGPAGRLAGTLGWMPKVSHPSRWKKLGIVMGLALPVGSLWKGRCQWSRSQLLEKRIPVRLLQLFPNIWLLDPIPGWFSRHLCGFSIPVSSRG